MEYLIVLLPLLGSIVSGFFGKLIGVRQSQIITSTLVLISGIILMLGRVPAGELIPWWLVLTVMIFGVYAILAPFIKNKKIFSYSIIFTLIFSYKSLLYKSNQNDIVFYCVNQA